MGVFTNFTTKRYEGNDGDIKVVKFDTALYALISGWNVEPGTAKNDNDSARATGARRKTGQRARRLVFKGVSAGKIFYKRVIVLEKTVYLAAEPFANDPGTTTYNFTWKGVPMVYIAAEPELNH